jgi:hypothetical protein
MQALLTIEIVQPSITPSNAKKRKASNSTTGKPKKRAIGLTKKRGKKGGPKQVPVIDGKPIKNPSGAYIHFGIAKRSELVDQAKKANPDFSHKEAMSLLGKAWKELGDEDKKQYEAAAAKDKVRYEEELERATMVDASSLKKPAKKPKKGEEDSDEEMDDPIEWLTSGHKWVGKTVRRIIEKDEGEEGFLVVECTVTAWVPTEGDDFALWHVQHADGDEEDLEEWEMLDALAASTNDWQTPTDGLVEGVAILADWKKTGGGWFAAKIAAANPDGTFAVDYADGAKESKVSPNRIRYTHADCAFDPADEAAAAPVSEATASATGEVQMQTETQPAKKPKAANKPAATKQVAVPTTIDTNMGRSSSALPSSGEFGDLAAANREVVALRATVEDLRSHIQTLKEHNTFLKQMQVQTVHASPAPIPASVPLSATAVQEAISNAGSVVASNAASENALAVPVEEKEEASSMDIDQAASIQTPKSGWTFLNGKGKGNGAAEEGEKKAKKTKKAAATKNGASSKATAKPAAKATKASNAGKPKQVAVLDGQQVKKPSTAYACFTRSKGAELVEEATKANPDFKPKERTGLIGKAWKELGDEDKKQYEAAAAKDKARYEEELERATMVDASSLKKPAKKPAKKPKPVSKKQESTEQQEEDAEEDADEEDEDAFAAKLAEQEQEGEEVQERQADI